MTARWAVICPLVQVSLPVTFGYSHFCFNMARNVRINEHTCSCRSGFKVTREMGKVNSSICPIYRGVHCTDMFHCGNSCNMRFHMYANYLQSAMHFGKPSDYSEHTEIQQWTSNGYNCSDIQINMCKFTPALPHSYYPNPEAPFFNQTLQLFLIVMLASISTAIGRWWIFNM